MAEIYNRSRLLFKELLSIYGVQFWELDRLPTIPEQPDDVYYQITETDRIDLLAGSVYGDVHAWWIIAIANDMDVLPTDFQPGRVIRLPSPAYVASTLYQRAVVKRGR